jgi:hypothetical protein
MSVEVRKGTKRGEPYFLKNILGGEHASHGRRDFPSHIVVQTCCSLHQQNLQVCIAEVPLAEGRWHRHITPSNAPHAPPKKRSHSARRGTLNTVNQFKAAIRVRQALNKQVQSKLE